MEAIKYNGQKFTVTEKLGFTIPGRLSGLNELIGANRSGAFIGAGIKKRNDELVLASALEAGLGEVGGPIALSTRWYEKNARRDVDNVVSAKKFILDGLVKAGVLKGDGQRYVKAVADEVLIDSENPRVEVEVLVLEER